MPRHEDGPMKPARARPSTPGERRARRRWSAFWLGALMLSATSSSAQAVGRLDLRFAIDRGGLPPLPYYDITLKVDALGAPAASVVADGLPIPSRVVGGRVVFTTSGRDVVVTLQSPTRTTGAGAFERATLKDDKAWAWSHGFDDNTNLQAGIEAFRARGWRATLFMICSSISDTRQEENWIIDAPGLRRLLGEGWSVGNHSWDHGGASDVASARASVVACSERLAGIVAGSPRPAYKVIAFAAPNFDAGYASIVRGLRDSGVTHLLYDESGNDSLIRIDPGATSAPSGAVPFDRDLVIGRYTPIGWDAAAAIAAIDSVAGRADSSTHLWFNSLAHGSNEASLVPVLDYVYRTYGPGGTNDVLVAPSDEVYSYLLVRDGATVVFRGSTSAGTPLVSSNLLWHHQGTGSLYLWTMDGAAQTGGMPLSPGGVSNTQWQVRGTADFSGDGQNDLLWHHQGTGELYLWTMNGTTQTEGSYLGSGRVHDTQWQVRGLADFTGDGKNDVLWQHQGTGDLYLWAMNGMAQTGGAYLSPARVSDTQWRVVGVGDFNGDGKADLLWHHQGTGDVYVWFMNGTVQTGGASLGRVPSVQWQIRQVGDFNADGKRDILWHHQTAGALYVWYLNGTASAGGSYLSPSVVTDTNWKVAQR